MRLALSILGRTYTLALTSEPDDEPEGEEEGSAVTGTPSSVEFGFAQDTPDYWTPQVPNRR